MISVIIPTYNREQLIQRAVKSVLNQSWTDLELIVVDDCSTDRTRQVIEAINDPRLRYCCMPQNSGACAARNYGVALARGEYIAFQDSDDEWMPLKLECQMEQLQQSGADVVFCAFERYGTDGKLIHIFPQAPIQPGQIHYEQLLAGNLVSTQTLLGRRECFESIPFDIHFPRLQDWELMLRMVQQYDVRYFNTPYVRMYEQTDSISKRPEKMVQALDQLLEKHRPALEQSRKLWVGFRCMQLLAAKDCGQTVWHRFLAELSLHNPLKTNLQLIKLSLKSLIVQR